MFTIGDKVAYPLHGAGLIESIENKIILGENRAYYIIRIQHGKMQVMVPVEGSDTVGLRHICEKSDIDGVMEELAAESTPMDVNWNRRNRDNMEKLKTGDLKQVAAVIRNLARVDAVKKLSTGEKKLLVSAKQILSSEIAMILGIEEEAAIEMIEKAI